MFTTSMHHLIANEFKSKLDDRTLSIDPSISLYLESNNTRLPIDLTDKLSDITEFDFAGTFKAEVDISVEGIPVELYISASSDDITTASSIDFDISLDLDLRPIKESFIQLLVELDGIRYPNLFQRGFSHLPRLDFSCICKSGIAYLGGDVDVKTLFSSPTKLEPKYPLSGFLSALADGCSSSELRLSGGYYSPSEELGAYGLILTF